MFVLSFGLLSCPFRIGVDAVLRHGVLLWWVCLPHEQEATLHKHIHSSSHLILCLTLLQIKSRSSQLIRRADTPLFTAHNFSVPIDHFPDEDKYEPHSNETFSIR
jgi:hypothetical protein